MRLRPGARLGAAALLFVASCAALGLLWAQAQLSEDVPFLAYRAPAEWIVYPQAPSLDVRDRVELKTVFLHEFELPARPQQARLRLRMHRRGELWINDRSVRLPGAGEASWKQVREADVSSLLHAGRNRIRAQVAAESGPPALWLALEGEGVAVATGESWRGSLMGAEWAPARLAREPMIRWGRTVPDPAAVDAHNPRPRDALAARAPEIALAFALGAALAGAVAWGLRGARRLSARWTAGAWLASAAVALAMFTHNRRLHGAWGFDPSGHYDYVAAVLGGRLPLANEGFQMYQPPLYYLLAAGLLRLFGFEEIDRAAAEAIRWLGCAALLLQFAFLLLALRELLPERPGLVLCAFAFGVCLPAQLYLAHFVTNENWVAALSSGALWWTIRMLRRADSSLRDHAVLGAFLGLAVLAKFSALVVVALCPAVLLVRRWREGGPARRAVLPRLALTLAVVALLSGWHYARVAAHFGGNPFVGNWDVASGYQWWQDPGYRVSDDYLRFGRVLERPLQSALASVPDSLYSTLWGDGMLSGSGFWQVTPPWDLERMAAGYWLALGPCLALLLGGLLAGVDFVRAPRAERFLLIAALGATLFLLLSLTLRLPYYAQAKAFYGLSTLVPLAFCFALGFDALALRRRALAPLGVCWLAGWALVALATFFAPAERLGEDPTQLVTQLDPGGFRAAASASLARGDEQAAIDALRRSLALDPDQKHVGPSLAELLRRAGRPEEALAAARAALRVEPYDAALHVTTGALWRQLGNLKRAAFHEDLAHDLSRLRRAH
jgi:tetratricopeptide (TPR) repeat protein